MKLKLMIWFIIVFVINGIVLMFLLSLITLGLWGGIKQFTLSYILLCVFCIFVGRMFVYNVLYSFKNMRHECDELARNAFIKNYLFPSIVSNNLLSNYPFLNENQVKKTTKNLGDYFQFHLHNETVRKRRLSLYGNKKIMGVSMATALESPDVTPIMPSRILDSAWETFSKTSEYADFCNRALGFYLNYNNYLLAPTASEGQGFTIVTLFFDEYSHDNLIKIWYFCCKQEGIDPFFPQYLPGLFALDEKLGIPSGFQFHVSKTSMIDVLDISIAPSPKQLKQEIQQSLPLKGTLSYRPTEHHKIITYMGEKLRFYLSYYEYCHQYEEVALRSLLNEIDKYPDLAVSVYGRYTDIDMFKQQALDSAAPTEDIGCSCGVSV